MKITILALTLAATTGAGLRWFLSLTGNSRLYVPDWLSIGFALKGPAIPVGTLAANVAGSIVLGWAFYTSQGSLGDKTGTLYFALATGFCGSLTTFSTLCLELVVLTERGHLLFATLYTVLSLTLGIGGILLGKYLAG